MSEYSSIVAPITNLLRDKWFASKRARKPLLSWSEEQDKAFPALTNVVTSPPILALSDWKSPFQPRTDASDTGLEVAVPAMHGY